MRCLVDATRHCFHACVPLPYIPSRVLVLDSFVYLFKTHLRRTQTKTSRIMNCRTINLAPFSSETTFYINGPFICINACWYV